ncbi:MAG: hypothetical protein VKJ24_16230 [Synechococcales bacterium]|nr:hypothetical protein [Synechococcales bacterium]
METADAPEVVAAFAAKADELAILQIAVSGDFRTGWLDSSECCRVILKVAGIANPRGWFSAEEVQHLFRHAEWPNFDELQHGSEPWDSSEYNHHVIAKVFVDLCLEFNLELHFS